MIRLFGRWDSCYQTQIMRKTALLFAGQGAQKVGMGHELCQNHETARNLFAQADEILGYSLSSICFEGPEADLTQTDHAQPGIFLTSWAALAVLKQEVPSLQFEATAGLSLGEFTALAAAGALSFADGLKITRARGRFMQEACDATAGGMAAIIGLDEGPTREVCEAAGVQLANLNCPGQLVISGEKSGIEAACEAAKAAGAKRALPLAVAGAYHSRLMASAQPSLRTELEAVGIQSPSVPVYSNVTAAPHGDPASILGLLVDQVTSSVLWEASIRAMLEQGFTTFIELGPGTALTGFMKRISRDVEVLNVEDAASLAKTVEALKA